MTPKKYFFFFFLLIIISCTSNNNFNIDNPEIIGLSSPIKLQPIKTTVYLSDYFNNPFNIDSIIVNRNLKFTLADSNKQLVLWKKSDSLPKLSNLDVWINNTVYSILIKDSDKILYKYLFNPKNKIYKKVQLAGEINQWNPNNTILKLKNGLWETNMYLQQGKYQYQVVVDGKWMLDTNNPDSADNHIGGFNSVLTIGNPDNTNSPQLYTLINDKNHVTLKTVNDYVGVKVFWNNFKLDNKQIKIKNNFIEITIPKYAKLIERSYLRAWTYNNSGISNNILIPLDNGEVLSSAKQIQRSDKEAMIIYNIMVDRFYNGNKNNDKPIDDPDVLPKVNYFGGDIAGITEKVKNKYFKDLGINTLWISPIIQNAEGAYGENPKPYTKFSGYHGYWPISFTKIDYRFGTPVEFNNLVNSLHSENMNILLDFVANHVHENHPIYKAHKDWATSLYLPDGSLNLEKWDEHRLTTWFDTFLPTLNLEKPEITNMLSDSAIFWLKEYNLDGFRHDATKHIPLIFWRTLTQKIKNQVEIPYKKNIFQIGETYGSPELISSYLGSGMLNGQFDFNTYDAAVASIIKDNESFDNLATRLQTAFDYYGYHNLMGNITDNQDRARFMAYADGSLRFDEDAKLAGWTRKISIKNPVAYKKMAMLQAFIMSIPGVPVIFYGDEIGMTGANDPDNRRMMRFNNLKPEEVKLKATTKKLISYRKSHLEMIYGDTKILMADNNYFVLLRNYFGNVSILVLCKNRDSNPLKIRLPKWILNKSFLSNFDSNIKVKGDYLIIDINSNQFDIISNSKL